MNIEPNIGQTVTWRGRKAIVIPTTARRFTYKPELYVTISYNCNLQSQVQYAELKESTAI